MNSAPLRRAPSQIGNQGRLTVRPRRFRHAFTLLEMMMVLLIIALLFAVSMPAMQSAFTQQAVRRDSHELALMVRTAMIQSAEQHRPYVIDLTSSSIALHPQGTKSKDDDDSDDSSSAPATNNGPIAAVEQSDTMDAVAPMEDVTDSSTLEAPTKLEAPDAHKLHVWIPMEPTSWVFLPGELCPAPRVRFSRGEAYVEMSFNALTGDVEDETSYFP